MDVSWREKLCEECHGDISNDLDQALRDTAKKGCVNCVKVLIDAGAGVNKEDGKRDKHNTPLLHAAREGHPECVKALIEAGADVNDHRLHIPLIVAAEEGNIECVKVLIEAGADVNLTTFYSNTTALIQAGRRGGNKEILKLLLDAGADVNAQNDESHTALFNAAHDGYTECARFLIKAGADLSRLNIEGYTILLLAVEKGDAKFVKSLTEAGADVNATHEYENTTPLMHTRKVDCARRLLRAGAKINLKFDNRNTLEDYIFQADGRVEGTKETMVMLLYAAGETIDATTIKKNLYGGVKEVPVPDYLKHEDLKLDIKHLCREAIRKHLINIDPHQHLFGRIPQLGLPGYITAYLLYNVSLAEGDDEEEKDDEDDDVQ